MLKTENVTKCFRGVKANNSISLEAKRGEVSLLLGLNGAGKSTFIKCICGLLKFDGKILVGGKDCRSLEAKRVIGYIPETPALYDYLTVDEHLDFIERAYKCKNPALRQQLLDRFELADKKQKLAKELSKGMQQKLSICCTLLHEPELIIFDEPMVGLDPLAIKTLKSIFEELKNEDKAVLISTHILDSVENCWDKAYILSLGELKAEMASDEDGKSLEEMFFAVTGVEDK